MPSSNHIKSFLDAFAYTMKRSIKHAVNHQSLSIQNRCLRSELQSRDTYKFISSAQQALFEEILAEKIWYLYHAEHSKYAHGVPIHILHKFLHEEYIHHAICDPNHQNKSFANRLLKLTKLHASYQQDIWLRMHQLPFYDACENNIDIKPFAFKKSTTEKQHNLHKITTEDIIGCNIDRTGRIAWYYAEDHTQNPTDHLVFFPGIFEPDTIFIGNALHAVNQLNALVKQSKGSHNTHILLQSSHLLENTKLGFFEQELWRFLMYYPSGGHHQKLLDCYPLFGISSKDIMKQYLNKYIYAEDNSDKYKFSVFKDHKPCAIEYDKDNDFFTVNPKLSLTDQIHAFQSYHYNELEHLKTTQTHGDALNEQYDRLFTACLSTNSRLFYDIKLLKSVFWSWCYHPNASTQHIFPKISIFEHMANELIQKYQNSVNRSLGGKYRDVLELSQYEYTLLRQLWYIGIKHNIFDSMANSMNLSFVLKLSDIALDKNDINWFISIMNTRLKHKHLHMDQSFIYGSLFNVIHDVVSKLSVEEKSSEKHHQQLTKLLHVLNDSYALLPKRNKDKTYHEIDERFMLLFNEMTVLSNHDALKEIKLMNMSQSFLQRLAKKIRVSVHEIQTMDSLSDVMDISEVGANTRSSAHIELVRFHHHLRHRRFDIALRTLLQFETSMIDTGVANSNPFVLDSAKKMMTLPTDPKIWRSGAKKPSTYHVQNNLQPLKIEIPTVINVCIGCIPKLELNQNEMANMLYPIQDIMELVTREHGSMHIAHQIFKNILQASELPLPMSLVTKYLDLYIEYDSFLSSPLPMMECILKRYIPPFIISSNMVHRGPVHSTKKRDANHMGLHDFSVMTKSDGIDDKMDPFTSFTSARGYKILPLAIYNKMFKLLNQYSSVHGLGHFNMEQNIGTRAKHNGKQGQLNAMYDAAVQDDDAMLLNQYYLLSNQSEKHVVDGCDFVWKIMEWDGYNGDIQIYNLMLDTLCKWDEITSALSLFEQMVGDHTFNSNKDGFIEPNHQTLYILCDAMIHPLNITHFVQNISPNEWHATLSNKIKHVQHQSWFNIYKHRGQILHDLAVHNRSEWINLQNKYGDIVHHSTNELFFGYFPRTQFLMAAALNRLEEITAVLNDNASEWLDNLIECYVIQYLPDYKHIFKVKPHTLRMEIIQQICDSKTRFGFETTLNEQMVLRLWSYVQEFRRAPHRYSHRKFERDCAWTISDLKKLFSVPTLSEFISPQINGNAIKSNSNFLLTPSFAKSLFSSKSNAVEQEEEEEEDEIETAAESQAICKLMKLEETIDAVPTPFASSLKIHHLKLDRTDLYSANVEWWQSQYDCLRPTLMPQAISHPELSRNISNCRKTIFSAAIPTPSQYFDEHKYIQSLLQSSCNLWTLMHVCATYYRSFGWENAHYALLRIATELSGRSRPFCDVSWMVYDELLNHNQDRKKNGALHQRSMQQLFWLTGEPYVYNKQKMNQWKGYNTIITSLHWIYLILNMNDKQVGIVHNTFLFEFITHSKEVTTKDLCYLLAARIEGGLFNKGGLNAAYISETSQAILNRLFAIFNTQRSVLYVEDVSKTATAIGSYLVEHQMFDIIDRLIHSIAKYPDLIALNDDEHSYQAVINKTRFNMSQFLTDLLLSMESKFLVQRKSDGFLAMMTRITNNILLIHSHYNKANESNRLSIKEWTRLFYDNFDRLTISEALLLLQTLMNVDQDHNDNQMNWNLITKLSFRQFNAYNLEKLSSNELTQILQILMDVDKKCSHNQEEHVISTSLIHNIEHIISHHICNCPDRLQQNDIQLLEQCLDYFNLNKSELIKAQHFFVESHKDLTPHWTKFYKTTQDNQTIIDEWWKKDK
eukprot:345942_1